MKLYPVRVIGALAALAGQQAAADSLLAQAHFATTSAGVAAITDSLNLTIGIGPAIKPSSALLFDRLFVERSDVGRTFVIGREDDPDFVSFADCLTDGRVSFCSHVATAGGGAGGVFGVPETRFFTELPPGNNGIDLGGFEMDHFTLQFDALQFASPGTDPNGNGNWTDYSYSATFSVYGEPIPEPSTIAVLFCGSWILLSRFLLGGTIGELCRERKTAKRHHLFRRLNAANVTSPKADKANADGSGTGTRV